MIRYIEANKDRYGVEPICSVLPIAPSTYHDARRRPPSARALRDDGLKAQIRRVHAANFGVYGARKVWHQLRRVRPPNDIRTVESDHRVLVRVPTQSATYSYKAGRGRASTPLSGG